MAQVQNLRTQDSLDTLYQQLARHPQLDLSRLQRLETLARMLLKRFSPEDVIQKLELLHSEYGADQPLITLAEADVSWMSQNNQQRFHGEVQRLLAMPTSYERDKYMHANESWKEPLGLFADNPEYLQDLKFLGLEPPCSPEEIKQAFRQKAQDAHPDLGGEHEDFIQLKAVYLRALKNCF